LATDEGRKELIKRLGALEPKEQAKLMARVRVAGGDELTREFKKLVTVSKGTTGDLHKMADAMGQLDFSGNILANMKKANVLGCFVLPDDKDIFFNVLKSIIDIYSPNLIITSGGTGLSETDITNSILSKFCTKLIPGIGELLRHSGSNYSSKSWLSCAIAGIYKKSFIISLPGNPSAVFESLTTLDDLLLHAVNTINK